MGTNKDNEEKDLISRFHVTTVDSARTPRHLWEKLDIICRKNRMIPHDKLEGLEDPSIDVPFTINRTEYLAMRSHLESSAASIKGDRRALNRVAYKAYLLFGTPQKLMAYTKTCNKLNKTDSSSLVMMDVIDFPAAQDWAKINFRAWGEAFLKFGSQEIGPRFYKYSPRIDPVRNSEGVLSLLLTDYETSIRQYRNDDNAGKIERLKSLAVRFGKNAKEFDRMLIHTAKPYEGKELPPEMQLPDFRVDGNRFGLPGTVFQKLRHDDPRILVLGDYTGCCERVTDEPHCLEKTVQQACTTNINAYYGVECDDEILAHSWAWRGKRGEMVFDGFESRECNFHLENMRGLIQALYENISNKQYAFYKINGLFIGQTAAHLAKAFAHVSNYPVLQIMPDHIRGQGMEQNTLWQIIKPSYPYSSGHHIAKGVAPVPVPE